MNGTTNIICILLILASGFCFVRFNNAIILGIRFVIGKATQFLYKVFGKRIGRQGKAFSAVANLNKGSLKYKFYRYYNNILINLEWKQYQITVFGFLLFLLIISIITLGGLYIIMPMGIAGIPALLAIFFLYTVLFRLRSLAKSEKREACIMDAVDLLVSDVRGGVYNAIVRYQDNIHPEIKPYFIEFLENIKRRGYSFNQSMQILNERLGETFTDFANKAIMYEAKADKSLIEIFSGIVEGNRQKRILRYNNSIAFSKLRSELIIATVIIVGYTLILILTNDFCRKFLTDNIFGNLLVIADIVVFASVLAFITAIKVKTLD